ncbi:MAG: glycosyltransferase [Candidatus Eisenbacteria sp.]|nr:glycosyltransferase [Candidatus Eisenbacteria bacterium]
MNILFLTSRFPYPPNRGDRVRTFNFLKRLSLDHDIQLLSFIQSEEELRGLPALEPYCRVETVHLPRSRSYWNMLSRAGSALPFQTLYYESREMEHLIHTHTSNRRFDVVYIHLFRMAPFALALPGVPRILDLTDCISGELAASIPHRSWFLRRPLRMEADRIRRYETRVASGFDEVWTISEADRSEILRMAPGAPVHVVPNGVDESLYSADPSREGMRLGFLGNLSVPHNIDAARFLALEIMPRIRGAFADSQLELVGHGPTRMVRQLHGRNGTVVTGPVENLREWFESLAVFVSPLRFAAGVQNKILEAMAAGVPVVTTSHGNRGLAAGPEKEILVRDRPDDFAEAVISLLHDPAQAARLGQCGRSFVRDNFSWDAVAERVANLACPSIQRETVTSQDLVRNGDW